MFKPKLVIIPEIEISSGLCTSCIKGVEGTEGLYSNLSKNPLDLCLFWRKENAKILNLTNLDSYGAEETQLSSNAILYISFAMEKNIPLQLMSNFKSTEECCYYLDSGISRIVISQLLITDPNGVYNLIQKYSTNKIIFCVNSENGNAVFPDISPDISAISFANRTKEMGSHRIIYKKNQHGNNNQVFDIDELKDFYNQTGLSMTLYNSIRNTDDLLALNDNISHGIDSVILGKALYENYFPCQALWRIFESGKSKFTSEISKS